MIELVEDKLDIDTYLELRQSVNFRKLTRDQAKKGLSNSMYTLVAFKDGKAVGMGKTSNKKPPKSEPLCSRVAF